jgi:hypothetical protein
LLLPYLITVLAGGAVVLFATRSPRGTS